MNIPENLSTFFNHESVVGIDLGQDSVRVASACLNSDGKVEVHKLGRLDYAPTDSNEEVASRIRELWKKQDIRTRTVSSCLHTPSLMLKHFKYTNLSENELESALLLEAEQLFQKEPQDLLIDWYIYYPHVETRQCLVSTLANTNATTLRGRDAINRVSTDEKNDHQIEGVLVAALAKDVNRHLNILKMAGLYPVAIDSGCMAVSNLFIALNSRDTARRVSTENVCLVNVGRHTVDIAVIYPPTQKTTGLPGDECGKTASARCHRIGKPESESADNPDEYAEIIEREFRHSLRVGVKKGTTGLPVGFHEGTFLYPSNIYSKSVVWQEKVDYLANHIADVLRYCEFKLRKGRVEKIIFTGSVSSDAQFRKDITKALDLPVEFWDPLESSNLKKDHSVKQDDINGLDMAVCLGLALRTDQRPKTEDKRPKY